MKILYLCNKNTYETKMSRVRFHSMDAIGRASELVYSGLGWENYNDSLTVQENICNIYGENLPDLVVAYKPLELRDFSKIPIPKVIRYNEMWDVKWTNREIEESGSDIVVCHHKNDIVNFPNIKEKIINIPHYAESSIYKDYGLEKKYDILFTGATGRHYPFRSRLMRLIPILKKNANVKILKHPGGNLEKARGSILEEYAKLINMSRITLTCSSKYKYRLGKYVEIPMCGSVLAGDLPNEDQDFFKKFMLVLDPKMSDDEIVKIITDCLEDSNSMQEKIINGIILNKNYTQENYAERFLRFVGEKI